MSTLSQPPRAVVVIGILSHDEAVARRVRGIIERRYGTITHTLSYPFSHSAYYEAEMGGGLVKTLWVFDKLMRRERIVDMKRFAVKLERRFSRDNKRVINIDPGLLTLENFILATGKNFSHRVYLGRGVYVDLTLIYSSAEKRYGTLPWTYPDFSLEPVIAFLNGVRKDNASRLKHRYGVTA
ncbi:MAG: DUF4416 family protein [Spirochaetes bacterium]|nr:DUF4416 family protein [Spirochaetota bacterium]